MEHGEACMDVIEISEIELVEEVSRRGWDECGCVVGDMTCHFYTPQAE